MYFSIESDTITPCGGFIHYYQLSSSSAVAARNNKRDNRRRQNFSLSNTKSKAHFNGEKTKFAYESTCVSQSADIWFKKIQSRWISRLVFEIQG